MERNNWPKAIDLKAINQTQSGGYCCCCCFHWNGQTRQCNGQSTRVARMGRKQGRFAAKFGRDFWSRKQGKMGGTERPPGQAQRPALEEQKEWGEWPQERGPDEAKGSENNTWDSNVVPHRSTNQARTCLTSLSGREAVLSCWYGRSHCWIEVMGTIVK